MPNFDTQTILLTILGVVALAILAQAILLFAILLVIRKTARKLTEQVEELHSEISPILHNTRELFHRVAPHVENTAADLAAMARSLRSQTADIQNSARDVLERLQKQIARVDAMISTALNGIDRATGFVTEVVAKPVRQASAILASVRAIIDSLRHRGAEVQPEARDIAVDDDFIG
jgi:uncharacterized protein YoxC